MGRQLSTRSVKRKIVRGPVRELPRYRNADDPVLSVIIPVFNERKTIAGVIAESYRIHPSTEVIVVANGTSDGTKEIAARMGARVVSYDQRLGHDVGRSVGARYAKGGVLLFTDGDIVLSAKSLRPLVNAVVNGVDVALNAYNGPTSRKKVHKVVLAKHAFNHMLGRPDLKGASMTTIPHAISRRALQAIGAEALCVPPKAQAMAIHRGLRIEAVQHINVGLKNPLRLKTRKGDPLGRLIVGDHLEALNWIMEQGSEGVAAHRDRPGEPIEAIVR